MQNSPAQNLVSESSRLVTIFGGSGFVGRHAVRAFAKAGWRVRVAVRRPDLAFFLQPLGNVGQIQAVQANVRYPASIARAVQDSDLVINLVSILAESGRQSFEAVNVFGSRAIAKAAKEAGVPALIYMSSIGADENAAAAADRTRARGEAAVKEAFPDAVITRASIIVGPEDSFFNRFATMARIMPALPLIGGGTTKFQPVFVGDIAQAFLKIANGSYQGTTFEFGGPQVSTFKELLQFMLARIGRSRILAPLPFPVAKGLGLVTEIASKVSLGLMPKEFLLTRDQVERLKADNVVSDAANKEGRTLAGLGITPTSYEIATETYLQRYRKTGEFDTTKSAQASS